MYVGGVPEERHGFILGGKEKVYLRWQQDSASAHMEFPTFVV